MDEDQERIMQQIVMGELHTDITTLLQRMPGVSSLAYRFTREQWAVILTALEIAGEL
jgi:hypothetical protein